MTGKVDDVRLPFSTVDSAMGDIYSVLWEPEMLRSMGDTINILATEALTQGLQQVLASTFLTALMAALTVPVVLTKLSYLIDNPWAVSLDRAWSAGLILADSLIDRNLGTRPVTLVGYSLGSRVIFSCLLELARKGGLGLVQNVYLFGSPVVVKRDEYLRARSVVSGRFVNAYNRNDWILGYLFRLTNGGIRRVGGLAPIEGIPMLENMDVSEFVEGHMDYRAKMPRLLRECGWLVDSDEFTEIEDPDPDNHASRQRELINEIEEARKELENEGKASKGGWLSFGRKKKGKKKEWEIYEDAAKSAAAGGAAGGAGAAASKTEDKDGNNHGVLFDVDAIRAELAREVEAQKDNPDQLLEVKELPSTLPPIKLNVGPMAGDETPSGLTPMTARPIPSPAFPRSPRENSGETQRTELTTTYRSSHEVRSQYEYKPSESAAYGGNGVGGGYRSPSYHNAAPSLGGGGGNLSFDDGFGNSGGGDEEIQMTFDTSFDEPPRSASLFPPAAPPKDAYMAAAPVRTAVSPTAMTVSSDVSPTTAVSGVGASAAPAGSRPAITTSQTMPNIGQSNPWANLDDDFDDPDFGQEKEISMTFA
ncbi:transmembrane and coiled-coil domain-containing protein 4 [Magnaporthiopsis poae ATCC 64411]|uniref:Transmembrane and coiled-coil domain-containing protein 4 n=1 Tax=Magnaporthiopsis poae (strain ATCC 64411 / 73-15) TaxID=644358 RepID=A0A0C4E229_MAGP6|nr:transmembrane and coiled-coil domain-containing protein 4 [Magnaporthiopsis poae ATCC 64411]